MICLCMYICQFLAQHNLFVPASFATCHQGPSGTWLHPHGEWTRNDVLAISGSLPLLQCTSWADVDTDVSLVKDDHRPARVIVQWHAEARNTQTRPRLAKCPPAFCAEALRPFSSVLVILPAWMSILISRLCKTNWPVAPGRFIHPPRSAPVNKPCLKPRGS